MGHTGVNILNINDLFWYDSFHMPLFIFISGYFLKVEKIFTVDYIKKQVKHLIVPFFIFNIVCCAFSIAIHYLFNVTFSLPENWDFYFIFNKLFLQPFAYGNFFWFFNDATWFILALFEVKMLNMLLRYFFSKFNINSEFIILAVYATISAITVSLSHGETGMAMQIVRPCYLLLFFQLGFVYKKFVEKIDTANNLLVLFCVVCIEFVLVSLCIPNIPVADIWKGSFRNGTIVTILLAINGIYFWLRISKILFKNTAKNNIVSYISRHTYAILINQLICIFIFKLLVAYVCMVYKIPGCDLAALRTQCWYYPYPFDLRQFCVFYFFVGLVCPLLLVYFYDNFLRGYAQLLLEKLTLRVADIKLRLARN